MERGIIINNNSAVVVSYESVNTSIYPGMVSIRLIDGTSLVVSPQNLVLTSSLSVEKTVELARKLTGGKVVSIFDPISITREEKDNVDTEEKVTEEKPDTKEESEEKAPYPPFHREESITARVDDKYDESHDEEPNFKWEEQLKEKAKESDELTQKFRDIDKIFEKKKQADELMRKLGAVKQDSSEQRTK